MSDGARRERVAGTSRRYGRRHRRRRLLRRRVRRADRWPATTRSRGALCERRRGARDHRLRRRRAAAARCGRARVLARGGRVITATFRDDLFAGRVALVVGRHRRHRRGDRRRACARRCGGHRDRGHARRDRRGTFRARLRGRDAVVARRARRCRGQRAGRRPAAARHPRQLRRYHSPRRRARSGGIREDDRGQPDRHDALLRARAR